jgi:endonuclease/exonuclease/phosphatase family metal-dependent hydrolase
MTDSIPRKPRRWLRSLAVGLVLVLAIPVVWHTQNRIRAKHEMVSVHQLGSAGARAPRANEPTTLTLACFNIAHARGTNDSNWSDADERDMRLVDISRLLRDHQVDIAVLNEVDFDSTWSGNENQARILAQIPGYSYLLEQRNVDVSLPFFRLRFGNAVLSRFPLEDAHGIAYPPRSRWEHLLGGSKQGARVDVVLSQNSRIRLMPIHLDHRDDATRVASAEEILKCARESSLPFFCLGDFNATRSDFAAAKAGRVGGAAMDLLLKSGLFRTSPESEPARDQFTFPSFAPDRTIDWIMIPTQWEIVSQEVVATHLSDHRAVVMRVRRQAPK